MEFVKFMAVAPFDMIKDWPLGTILSILLMVLYIGLTALVLYGVFVAFDSWFLDRQKKIGIVTRKNFTPSHTSMTYIYNTATNTCMPQIIHHPDCWDVGVDIGGSDVTIEVSQDFFDSVGDGASVQVGCVIGRFSERIYPKDILQL